MPNTNATEMGDTPGGTPPNESGRKAYGVSLPEDELVVVTLVPENVERLYYHRGQVAAVTNKRLLFIQPRPPASIRKLQDYYAIESVDLNDIRELAHSKTVAIGGLFAGLVLLLAGFAIGYFGLTGDAVGPGTKTIPVIAIPAGFGFVFGLRRRVLRFDTEDWSFDWCSGPLELNKTAAEVNKLKAFFDSIGIRIAGF